jgi:pimeloyl-ACP methyl ester carboxylesterase
MRLSVLFCSLLAGSAAQAAPDTLSTSDGVQISALFTGSGTGCAVLLHADQRSKRDWSAFADSLGSSNFRVVAPDLRGHGDSKSSLSDEDYLAMRHDVSAALDHLSSSSCDHLALVGAELGSVLALNIAAEDPRITNLVMMSPRLSSHGWKVSSAISAYGDRPLLLVVGESDSTGVRAAGALKGKAAGRTQLEVVKGDAIGPLLMAQSASLEGTLLHWITTNGQPTNEAGPRTGSLRAGDGGGIETTGTKIGEGD